MGSHGVDKKQPGGLVGEKSQTVFSANWKLDAMLVKNLQMLDVSKHRVCHRISMDQRIVNKRFQTKLQRSKITHARMTENRDLLRELLHRESFTFNTTVCGQDEKYAVTISPTQLPENMERPSSTEAPPKYGRGVRPAATPIVIVDPTAKGMQDTEAASKPDSARERKSLSVSISTVSETPRRRLTSAATVKEDFHSRMQEDNATNLEKQATDEAISNLTPDPPTQRHMIDESRKLRPTTAMPGLSKASRLTEPNRPKTALDKRHSAVPSGSPDRQSSSPSLSNAMPRSTSATTRPASSLLSQRQRTSHSGKQKHAMPSIFSQDKRPTILDINKERLARAKFPDRVKRFADTLYDLQTDPDQAVDYYTHRLLETLHSSAGRRTPWEFVESDAERRDAQRSVGNLNALNMTFGHVKRTHSTGIPVKTKLRAWESEEDVKRDDTPPC